MPLERLPRHIFSFLLILFPDDTVRALFPCFLGIQIAPLPIVTHLLSLVRIPGVTRLARPPSGALASPSRQRAIAKSSPARFSYNAFDEECSPSHSQTV